MACWQGGQYGCSILASDETTTGNWRDLLGESKVDCIKGNNEVLVVVDFLECLNYTRFGANIPSKSLMCDSILQTHALLINHRKLILVNSLGVLAVIAKVTGSVSTNALEQNVQQANSQALQPRIHIIGIFQSPVTGYGALHNSITITCKVISEIAKPWVRAIDAHAEALRRSGAGLGNGGSRHNVKLSVYLLLLILQRSISTSRDPNGQFIHHAPNRSLRRMMLSNPSIFLLPTFFFRLKHDSNSQTVSFCQLDEQALMLSVQRWRRIKRRRRIFGFGISVWGWRSGQNVEILRH